MFKWTVLISIVALSGCKKPTAGNEPAEDDDQARLRVEPFNRTSASSAPSEIYVALKGPLEYTKPVLDVLTMAELRSETTGSVWKLSADDSYAQIPEVYSSAEGYPLHLRMPAVTEGDYEVHFKFRSWGFKLRDENPAEKTIQGTDGTEFIYRFSVNSKAFFIESLAHCQTRIAMRFSEPDGEDLDAVEQKLLVSADGTDVSCHVTEQTREGSSGTPLMLDCDSPLKSPLKISFPPDLFFSSENHKFLASHSDPGTPLTVLTGAAQTPTEACAAIDRP